jgi:CrcB protein
MSFKSQLSRNRHLGERPKLDPVWRLALATGFPGALTTFSSFSAEVVVMLQQGRFALAAGTAGLHLFG